MTKLTTEITIEELQYRIHAHENDLTQMWTADYFLSVQKELLALKQAAKNPVAWVATDSEGFPEYNGHNEFSADCGAGTPLYAAPVLPKQPELIGIKVSIDTGSDNIGHRLFGEVVGINDSNGVPVLCIEVAENNGDMAAPAQPVIPEGLLQAINRLLDNDGSRGRFSAIQSYDAREDLERLLASTALPVIPEQPEPTISFYRDGIIAAAKWVENQRDAYDNEHGQSDPDTGAFEFGNDAQLEYSTTLSEIAEGIRSLHPASAQPVSEHKWINVDEGMPENYNTVLVCSNRGIIWCAEVEDGDFYPDEFPNLPREGFEITHWMPLPAAPAQESE